jgi:hypothetical protein
LEALALDYNSLGCGNTLGHVDIFEVENLTKFCPEETSNIL